MTKRRTNTAKKPTPTRRGPGRPPAGDPVLVAEGVRLLIAGEPDAAVRAAGVSLRTLYRARDAELAARRVAAKEKAATASAGPTVAPTPPPSSPAPSSNRTDPDADLVLPDEGGSTYEDTLRIARRLLTKVEARIVEADPVRFASLIEKANGLIGRVNQIEKGRPAPPPPKDALEELYSRERDEVILALEQYLPDPITLAEVHEARSRLAAQQ